MGFATDTKGGTTETLYVNGSSSAFGMNNSPGMAKIDLTTMTLTPIGAFDGNYAGQDAELTGTGDAQLFAFIFGTMSTVLEVDKTTAHVISHNAVNIPLSMCNPLDPNCMQQVDFAFSSYGGSFYLYTADTLQAPYTDVRQYDPMTMQLTTVLPQIGFNIVGAGVSTCAPTQPVH
jgi:hypothetical protein